jgi:hypothetical protein
MTDEDELAKRRAESGWPEGEEPPGRSVAQRAGEEPEEEDQGEMFPLGSLDGDPKRTLKNLVRANIPIEYTCSLMSAEVPMLGGLQDLESSGEVLVSWEPSKVEIVPKRDADNPDRVKSAKVRQKLRPTYVQSAGRMFTYEQVVDLMSGAGVSDAKIAKALGTSEAA